MDYSFNGEVAKIYGIKEAVFIHNIYWWVMKNKTNGRHCHDGKTWTYNTMKAFSELLPFFTEKQVRAIIKKLTDCQILFVGNYNSSLYDRTQWYALSEEIFELYEKGKCISPKGQMEVSKGSNGLDKMGECNTDSKPDSKPVSKHISEAQLQADIICKECSDAEIQNLLFDYLDMRKSIKSKVTSKGLSLLIAKLKKISPDESIQKQVLENAITSNWKSVYPLKPEQQKKDRITSEPTYDISQIDRDSYIETMAFGADNTMKEQENDK